MMWSEPHEDNPRISIVTWSGVATGEDRVEGKNLVVDTWVRKAGEKNIWFDLQKEKENFLEVKKIFIDPRASKLMTQTQLQPWKNTPEVGTTMENLDSTVLKSFLEMCMKLLRDQKVVEGLQELINNCATKEKP